MFDTKQTPASWESRIISKFGLASISFLIVPVYLETGSGISSGKHLMNNVKLCFLAESLGSVETMITHPATMTHAEVPDKERHARGLADGLVRLSVGIEDKEDIINDLSQALKDA